MSFIAPSLTGSLPPLAWIQTVTSTVPTQWGVPQKRKRLIGEGRGSDPNRSRRTEAMNVGLATTGMVPPPVTSPRMHHWACELLTFDLQRNAVGETTRYMFETYEQARRHAESEVARGGERVGAVVFALRRRGPRDSSFVPGGLREQ